MSAETPETAAREYSADNDDQLSQEDSLIDRGVDDLLDEGYSPPDRWREPREHETLDDRLAGEQPDAALDDGEDVADEQSGDDEVGAKRAGRLVAPDAGYGEDTESGLLGSDVGIDGGAASAEEAAMHVIED